MGHHAEVVTVVGGGASGALVAHQLLRQATTPIRVIVIEPRADIGRGIAYGTPNPLHLLNVRAGCMGADPDTPGDFGDWARQNAVGDDQDFVPRARYGDYLRSLLGPVEHVRAEAVDIVSTARGADVVLTNGSIVHGHRVVLAPGPSPQQWPASLRANGRRWISDPWAPGALTGLRPDVPVLLVGTGLTAVDVALSLDAAGHQEILAVSRHGLLPLAHVDRRPPVPTLEPPGDATPRRLLAWARDAAAQTGDWRPVVDALRPLTDRLWGGLEEAGRRQFLAHLHRRWETVRHRMAPQVAVRIRDLQESGRLTVLGGGVRSGRNTLRGVEVRLADRTLRVGAVVNCTGPQPDVRRTNNHLVRELLAARVVRPGPLGLGLATTMGGSIAGTDGRVWLVGPLRRGERWETTAIPEIRAQAAALPRRLWPEGAVVGA
jgi:uncharacterized NAD(P)/FAD-binding protein YdhS